MMAYFIPLIILATLASLENSLRLTYILNNKIFYSLIALFFIIFIGLRYEIGCDWEQYQKMFDKYSGMPFLDILNFNHTEGPRYGYFITPGKTIQELGHVILTLLSRNLYILNTIYASLFVIPLFFFCSKLKRTFLSLSISYPYYIIVVGMGPIRQAACISLLMLSFHYIKNNKYIFHFFTTIFSLLIHQFSIIFNGILFLPLLSKMKGNIFSKRNYLLFIILILISIYNLPIVISKVYSYISLPESVVPPAKGAFYVWFINFIPSLIFLSNLKKFNLKNNLKRILIILSIFEILLLPLVFYKSIVAYRLILYIFPSSILITSKIPDLKLFKLKSHYFVNSIIFLSFLNLIVWTNYAYHAYCWVPYKNLIFN